METVQVLSILFVSCINLAHCGNNFTQLDAYSSCMQAIPPVNASARNASCIYYTYNIKGGFCKNIVTSLYVFGDSRTLRYGELETNTFRSYFEFFDIADECRPLMRDLYCRYHFPPCDTSLDKPRARKICRRTCEFLDQELCKKEMILIREAARKAPIFDQDMINCSLYDVANGGDGPECYQYYPISGDDTKSTDCFYGLGVGYRGNVNITRSGRTCQAWNSQCPHRHWRIPQDATDEQNDFNMCRNPDSSAPGGPWCYTTDPNVRWEYCNVSQCPPRVPEESPTFVRGYPFNSTAIHISWNGLPPSRHKEQLLGYRVRYRRLGSLLFEEAANTTSNMTEIVVFNLVSQTKYEIEINGFNEIGHGPTSKILVIKTLSYGEVSIDVTLQLVMDADFSSDLLNRTSSKFVTIEENIKTSIKHHFNKSSVVTIYDVEILRFSNGSVKAEVRVLAIMNTNTTSKDEAIDHLIDGLDSSLRKGLNVTTIVVLEKPPPPKHLKVVNVQTRYIVFAWDQPKHGSFYQTHNYTVERKISASENFAVVKTLPYDQTRMTLKDLEPSTEYTIRLSSNNRYGRSDGVLLTKRTLPDRFIRNLIVIIVLPLTLAALFIVVVYLKYRPTCKSISEQNEMQLWMRGDWVEIRRSDVTLKEKLGEGAFGEAFKGLVRMDGKFRECAVKKLKANATELERRDLLNELQIMVTVGDHPNVISLIGACTRSESILVVVRLAENGCLLNQLKKNRENAYINVKEKHDSVYFSHFDKARIARDVACGMLHLSNKKCVHRDLAARNVLLGKNNVAMVSDFGLSRDVYESGEYENTSGGMLPVRWMALESLEDYTYNTKTDVWSFGVLLWEIESEGKMPYSGLGGMEVVEFIKTGNRLTKPERCPDEIYEIMMLCWRPDPSERPSFAELVTSLELQLHSKEDSLKDKTTEVESEGNVNLAVEIDVQREENNAM